METLKSCAEAWLANVGRRDEIELREFLRVFESASPALLRRAIDEYFAPNPQFPKLPGLRAVLSQLEAEIRAMAAKPVPNGAQFTNPVETRSWARSVLEQLEASRAERLAQLKEREERERETAAERAAIAAEAKPDPAMERRLQLLAQADQIDARRSS